MKTVAADGEVEQVIDVPRANPTNCAFEPSGRLGLVVTEAEERKAFQRPGTRTRAYKQITQIAIERCLPLPLSCLVKGLHSPSAAQKP
ncbi:MAG: hypothetical protein ACKOEZ_01440 [Spartobacteria bacterium]